LRVGIVWRGDPNRAQERFCAVSDFLPIARIDGVQVFSLQLDETPEERETGRESEIISLAGHLGDFPRTAAALLRLDLVLTIDTSMAHLAGALGIPVWVLLHEPADWRWLAKREDSPWYPTMRLFRQAPGEPRSRSIERAREGIAQLASWPRRPPTLR